MNAQIKENQFEQNCINKFYPPAVVKAHEGMERRYYFCIGSFWQYIPRCIYRENRFNY